MEESSENFKALLRGPFAEGSMAIVELEGEIIAALEL